MAEDGIMLQCHHKNDVKMSTGASHLNVLSIAGWVALCVCVYVIQDNVHKQLIKMGGVGGGGAKQLMKRGGARSQMCP